MGHSFVNCCKMYHSRRLIKLRHQSTAQSLRLFTGTARYLSLLCNRVRLQAMKIPCSFKLPKL